VSDNEWFRFFTACARLFGRGASSAADSESWCAWTTFAALQESVHYWSAGLPAESELLSIGTTDGGTWGQPFLYSSLAHLIVPAQFRWERISSASFTQGVKRQDIGRLSQELSTVGVEHRLTELVLEIKLF
jgi:hypothetical protein